MSGSRYRRGTSPKKQWWMNLVSACPEVSGVYFVWAGGDLLYIGSSIKMRERLINHNLLEDFRDAGVSRVTWAEFWSGNMLEIEVWLIGNFRPLLNSKHVPADVPEGYKRCASCHDLKPIYCFGIKNQKHPKCMQCNKTANAKNHIRGIGPNWKGINDAKIKTEPNEYRSDVCFVCGDPSLRRVGKIGACRKHFNDLTIKAQPGFAWRTNMLDQKSAAIGAQRKERDYEDLNTYGKRAAK